MKQFLSVCFFFFLYRTATTKSIGKKHPKIQLLNPPSMIWQTYMPSTIWETLKKEAFKLVLHTCMHSRRVHGFKCWKVCTVEWRLEAPIHEHQHN